MKNVVAIALLSLALASCAKSSQSTQSTTADASPQPSPTQSAVADVAASPASAVSTQPVEYTDLNGVFGQKEITQLASLGVFGDAKGAFEPSKTLARRDFVRWMFKANNAIWASDSTKQIHPAQGEDSSFKDVKNSDPDLQYIQGLQDSGVSVGFPDKTFRPEQSVTREQALAMKAALDRGGADPAYVITKKDPKYGYYNLPDWKDKQTISPEFVGAIATGVKDDEGAANESSLHVMNVQRTFGAIAMLKPKQPLTRAQAALLLARMGPHTRRGMEPSRSVSEALSSPQASATP